MKTLEELKMVEKEHDYEAFENSLRIRFEEVLKEGKPLFLVETDDLWEKYLNSIIDNHRQHYNCNCCKSFIRNYGNIAVMNNDGTLSSAVFDIENTPTFFKNSVYNMVAAIESGKVSGVFLSDVKDLGRPRTNGWGHLSLELPSNRVTRSIKTSGQLMAAKKEDFRILTRALDEFSKETIDTTISVLKSDTLYRGDRFLGVAEWFKGVKDAVSAQSNLKIIENIKWMYVATAQNGYCNIRSSMIGTLLEDVKDGLPFDIVASRFAEKMNPENYQRSQSAPTATGIRQAEKMVADMGIAESLERRYATIEEIPVFTWKNRESKNVKTAAPVGSVFGHIAPKQSAPKSVDSSLPKTKMTWEKFSRTVLPNVSNMEALIDNPSRFMALVTEAHAGSKNILQWDNPFSWYYHGGVDGEVRRRVEREGGKYEDNDIRCSLIWENYTDLDLHVMTPNGKTIYYGNKRSQGGWLDVDMNVSPESKEPVENIRWSKGEALNGHYEVRVNNYTDRGDGSNPFKMELEIGGQVHSFQGDGGYEDRMQTVFSFDYHNGVVTNLTTGNGSVETVSSWGASQGEFVKVNAITTSPNLWGDNPVKYAGDHTFFLLDGVQDTSEGKGRGFFNEMLTADLREIRKTLEAYTASTPIQGVEESSAAGLGFSKDSDWNLTLKVTEGKLTRLIEIDRLD